MVHIKKYRDNKRRNKSNKSNSTQYSLENRIDLAKKTTYTKSMRTYTSQKLKKKLMVYRQSEKQHRKTVYKKIKTLNQTNKCEHTLYTDLIN